jgi:hypothetical protein
MTPLRLKGMAKLAGPKGKEILAKLKPLDDVLAGYGLSETALNNMLAAQADTDSKDAIKLSVKRLLAPIKDRCAFIADMYNALKNVNENKAQQGPIGVNAELQDVKIEGDKARGQIVTRRNEKVTRTPIEFRKAAGGWRIELPLDAGKRPGKGAPEGPPRIKQ